MKKFGYFIMTFAEILFLAGAYLIQYFTRKKMGMARYVIYKSHPTQAKGETGGCNACCHGYSHSVVWNLYLYQLHQDDESVLFYQSDAWGGSAVANHKNRGDTCDKGKEKE